MSKLAYGIFLILALCVFAIECHPKKVCDLKANTLIVEGSIKVSCAAECQAKCQQDDCCEFFTYNEATKGCGLRNFVPKARSFSLGNISGLKYESPLVWTLVSNSVYVARSLKTKTAKDCQMVCLADEDCKAMIYNQLLGQCSLNFGEGPYREIPLGNQSQFGISSCLKANKEEELKNSVLITGGMGNVKWDFLDTVEALFAKCSLPKLPCKTCGHTLFKTFDAVGKPLIVACSRHDTNCYTLEDAGDAAGSSLTWTQHSSLTERLYDRTYPGSVFVPNRGIFIFGDLSRGTPKSQFLPIGSKQWQEGPHGPPGATFSYACVVKISDDEILTMGGYSGSKTNKVWKYHFQKKQWSKMPDLKVARHRFGCVLVQSEANSEDNYVLVSGGRTGYSAKEKGVASTELYYPDKPSENKVVGEMYTGRTGHTLMALAHPQSHWPATIFAIGGLTYTIDGTKRYLSSIEEWDPKTQAWKMTNFELNEARANFGALAIDREMICPQAS